MVKGYTNDLGFSVGNRYICLIDAQSYDLRSIQLRMMFYLSETYQEYLKDLGMTLYDVDETDVPQWEAYIIRTGKSEKGSEKTKNEIARKMLSKNMSPEDISEITGIPLEDVFRMSSENEVTISD